MMCIKIETFMREIHQWAENTFGKNRTPAAPLHHMKEEVCEAIEAIENWRAQRNDENLEKVKDEYADLLILLLNSASIFQFEFKDLYAMAVKKFDIVKLREWGEPDKNGVVKHIKKEPIKQPFPFFSLATCALDDCTYEPNSQYYFQCSNCGNYRPKAYVNES